MALVSIILPVSNVGEFLSDCLDSILRQTYSNIEILCIINNSSDNSESIAIEYSKKDPRIFLIYGSGGLGGARNIGIQHVKGEYICFIDSDDIISKNYIETMLICMQPDISVVMHTDIFLFKEISQEFFLEERSLQRFQDLSEKNASQTCKIIGKDLFERFNFFSPYPYCNAWSKLFRKSFFEKTKLRFPENRQFEDVNLTYAVFIFAKNIAYINNSVAYFYRRNNSKSITTSSKKIRIMDHFYNMNDFFQDQSVINFLEKENPNYKKLLQIFFLKESMLYSSPLYFSNIRNIIHIRLLITNIIYDRKIYKKIKNIKISPEYKNILWIYNFINKKQKNLLLYPLKKIKMFLNFKKKHLYLPIKEDIREI